MRILCWDICLDVDICRAIDSGPREGMCLQAFSRREKLSLFFFNYTINIWFIMLHRNITRNYSFDVVVLIIHLGDTLMKDAHIFVKIRIV